jgi:hypothetical protein
MNVTVSVRDIVDEMDVLTNESHAFLNKNTGELVTLTDDEISMAEDEDEDFDESPEWEREMIDKAREVADSDDYISLPDKYEIHEYEIMEDFCYSLHDEAVKTALLRGIQGKGAFRRFKDGIYEYGIEKQWYAFRNERLEEIAIDWLESNNIPYSRQKEG